MEETLLEAAHDKAQRKIETRLQFLNERKEATSLKISPLERSEKDLVLPKRNSGEKEKKQA